MSKRKLFVVLLDAGLVIAALVAVPVTRWMFRVLPDCTAAKVGLLCPACGGTRCVQYFFSGRFGEALVVNPFFFVLICYLGAALVLLNVGVLLKVSKVEAAARHMTDWRAVIVAAVLFAIFGVARNFW